MTRAATAWLLALLLCSAAVLLSIAFVDRPVAVYVHEVLYGTRLDTWARWLLTPLPALLVVLILVALGAAGLARAGKYQRDWVRTLQLAASSAVIALLVAQALKLLIGRGDAAPTYVIGGIYAFHPLHGAKGYSSFPSATTAGAAAVLAVIWLLAPRRRFLGSVALLAVMAAILVGNGHWVADLIGGGFLGAFVGWLAATRGTRGRIAP